MKFHQGTQQWEISCRAVENLSLSRICQCIAKQTVWLAAKSAKNHLKGCTFKIFRLFTPKKAVFVLIQGF